MGFLNKILKGLGFEDDKEEEKPNKPKERKEKINKNVTASFNLEKDDIEEKLNKEEQTEPMQEQTGTQSDFEVVKVKTQADIQLVIKKLKLGGKVLINIENLSGNDITRSLDFLTGGVYALGLNMQKVDDKIYLIQ